MKTLENRVAALEVAKVASPVQIVLVTGFVDPKKPQRVMRALNAGGERYVRVDEEPEDEFVRRVTAAVREAAVIPVSLVFAEYYDE